MTITTTGLKTTLIENQTSSVCTEHSACTESNQARKVLNYKQ